ncbi:protein farnesyltransferase subunit beta [Cricetulus griseus]|uniref:Protein farnesyltransferase subunit beta n=1 Tax=Cricetulus griseus TaxID=10029 RepID=A0A061I3X1_CRIGR|nr:protein farnesyltransferase subunit beta [Cricetulus griseus]
MASSSSFSYYCPPSSSPAWSEPLYSLRPEHARERLQDDSVETVTSIEQFPDIQGTERPDYGPAIPKSV